MNGRNNGDVRTSMGGDKLSRGRRRIRGEINHPQPGPRDVDSTKVKSAIVYC